jgi:hypothetical protein
MIKINPLDAHDRYQHFTKQSFSIAECVQDIVNKRPFGNHPFYIYAHTRTEDDGIKKRLIWQSRLTKPTSSTNSMLFKAYPGTDNIKIIWMIPAREMWGSYEKGKVAESEIVCQSIQDFVENRAQLDAPEKDDLSDDEINKIYEEISQEAKRKKMMDKLWTPNQNHMI